MKKPNPLDIFHLLTAMEMMTNMSMENSSITEHARPSGKRNLGYNLDYLNINKYMESLNTKNKNCRSHNNVYRGEMLVRKIENLKGFPKLAH